MGRNGLSQGGLGGLKPTLKLAFLFLSVSDKVVGGGRTEVSIRLGFPHTFFIFYIQDSRCCIVVMTGRSVP